MEALKILLVGIGALIGALVLAVASIVISLLPYLFVGAVVGVTAFAGWAVFDFLRGLLA